MQLSDCTHYWCYTFFFLLEHLNFGWAWMCLFFQQISASNVLIDVLKFWDQLSQKITPEQIQPILPWKISSLAKTLYYTFPVLWVSKTKMINFSLSKTKMINFSLSVSTFLAFRLSMFLRCSYFLARFQPKCSYKLGSNLKKTCKTPTCHYFARRN